MRLIDADEIDVREVICGASDFALDIREAVQRMIDRQPTIEAVPVVHGEWVDDSIESVWVRHKCSVCGFSKIMENRTVHDWSYCPNCGAKMDGKAV